MSQQSKQRHGQQLPDDKAAMFEKIDQYDGQVNVYVYETEKDNNKASGKMAADGVGRGPAARTIQRVSAAAQQIPGIPIKNIDKKMAKKNCATVRNNPPGKQTQIEGPDQP